MSPKVTPRDAMELLEQVKTLVDERGGNFADLCALLSTAYALAVVEAAKSLGADRVITHVRRDTDIVIESIRKATDEEPGT